MDVYFARPKFQLRSLTIPVRWEVTRRHSSYQLSWEAVRAHHRAEPVTTPADSLRRIVGLYLINAIGVTGEPPDPATQFEELEAAGLNQAWLAGAVHPISMRGLAGILLAALPKELLGELGLMFMEACQKDQEGCPPRIVEAFAKLQSMRQPELDGIADEPFVSINPAASQRQIVAALNSLLVKWKEERDLSEQRDRSDKAAQYLKVWDLREGWKDGKYDRSAELTLKKVATRLHKSLPTVANHYRQAFELIVGHPYTPDRWSLLFGVLKLSELEEVVGKVSGRRPLSSPVRHPVPESRLLAGKSPEQTAGPVSSFVDNSDDTARLIATIRQLISQGQDDEQIIDELDLSPIALAAIANLRSRAADSL